MQAGLGESTLSGGFYESMIKSAWARGLNSIFHLRGGYVERRVPQRARRRHELQNIVGERCGHKRGG